MSDFRQILGYVTSTKPYQLGRLLIVLLLATATLLSGCRAARVDTTYGKRRVSQGGSSVNGTAVLSEMFRDRGCRVRSWHRLSPKLDDADVIVWTPDDFNPPTGDQRDYLERWLYQGQKTLIYVGRDFDAAPLYYDAVADGAPEDQVEELMRQEAIARSKHDLNRVAMPDKHDAEWFTVQRGSGQRKVDQISGPWSKGIDAKGSEIYIDGTLDPPATVAAVPNHTWNRGTETEILLSSSGDPLVYRLKSGNWFGSQILVVTNGSMVLNMPLVNKENRKIAGKLIDESMPASDVVFLESRQGGPPIFDSEPSGNIRSGWEAFTIYPLGLILMHLAIAGILFCFSRYAIFGRPREVPPQKLSDFGHHIAALGRLLERTGDEQYARARLRAYNQTARRDSGTSHVKPKS